MINMKYCKCGNKKSFYAETCMNCRNTSGKNNPMYGVRRFGKNNPNFGKGKKISEENNPNWKGGVTKKKYFCIDCNKSISISSGIYGESRCKNCQDINYGKLFSGKNSPSYIDGRTKSKYPREFYRIRKFILLRDNFTCQNCGLKETKHKKLFSMGITVHHIDYDKNNNKEDNLITLCTVCNIKANGYRIDYKKYYKTMIELNNIEPDSKKYFIK